MSSGEVSLVQPSWKDREPGCVLRRRDPQIRRPRAVQENEKQELGGNMGAGGPLETADLVVKWIWWPKEDEGTQEAKIDLFLEKFSC